MSRDEHEASVKSIVEWVASLFEELHDPRVVEVAIMPGVRSATVESKGAAGLVRTQHLHKLKVDGVLGKMKKMAQLDVAERNETQRGRIRLLDFHGSPAEFEVTTSPVVNGEMLTLRRV